MAFCNEHFSKALFTIKHTNVEIRKFLAPNSAFLPLFKRGLSTAENGVIVQNHIYFAEKTVNCFSLPPLNLKRALNRCSSKILIVVKMLYDGCLKLDYRFLNTKSDAPPTCGGMKVTVR